MRKTFNDLHTKMQCQIRPTGPCAPKVTRELLFFTCFCGHLRY